METKEYRGSVDRSGWPAGPWDNEPDKVQWPDAETGLPCLAVRNRDAGNWCGYVGLPPSHPFHSMDYDHAQSGEAGVEVHGGLTFAGACRPGETEAQGICHVAGPGEPDHVWWLGFDCAHSWDYSPRDAVYARDKPESCWKITSDESYKTLAYVKRQCTSLAKQLAAA